MTGTPISSNLYKTYLIINGAECDPGLLEKGYLVACDECVKHCSAGRKLELKIREEVS